MILTNTQRWKFTPAHKILKNIIFRFRSLTFCVFSQERYSDQRGYFEELFHCDKYPEYTKPESGFQQVSLSHSRRGVLRGIHCSSYSKHVSVLHGTIYDVVVDLRVNSPTFRRWCAAILSCENRKQLHVPAGCGHAFVCLEDADVLYLQGGCFDPTEIAVTPFDRLLGIYWPTLTDIPSYIISDKDNNSPALIDRKIFADVLKTCVSPPKRILIIGASGQVGGALVEAFGMENVIGTYNSTPCEGMVPFDLESATKDPRKVEDLFTMCRPEIVCICAGRTWVDRCEVEGRLPYIVNCEGPRLLVRAAKAYGARSVYYSTDYIFDGHRAGKVYDENDPAG